MIAPRRRYRNGNPATAKESSTVTSHRSRFFLLVALTASALAVLAPAASAATPAPAWRIVIQSSPTHLSPTFPYVSAYTILAENVGGKATDGTPITITDELPAGLSLAPFSFVSNGEELIAYRNYNEFNDRESYSGSTTCQEGPLPSCTVSSSVIKPGEAIQMAVPLEVEASSGTVVNQVSVSGGGAAPAAASEETEISAAPLPFSFTRLSGIAHDVSGAPETRAGAHPNLLGIEFQLPNNLKGEFAEGDPPASLRNIKAALPKGFVVDPQAVSVRCTEAELDSKTCPEAAAVGKARITLGLSDSTLFPESGAAIYDMVPPPGVAAELAFEAGKVGFFIHLLGGVDSAGEYALTADVRDITQYANASGATVELWGDPSNASNDFVRANCLFTTGFRQHPTGCEVPRSETPFLTMPSACSNTLESQIEISSWQDPEHPISAPIPMTDENGNPVGVTNCEALQFEPTLEARPTTNVADSPSGLEVDLHIPQNENFETRATSTLKDTTVTLPEGLTVNPSAANGLGACTAEQVGLTTPIGQESPIHFSADPAQCPDSAKLGTVEVNTPLLEEPLLGAVYIAKPYENPFNSLLALYIAVNDPERGVVVKLAGKVTPDPQTGRLTATFDENPELPFEDFKLKFFGGSGGSLRTPAACGTYATTSSLEPWSAPQSGPPATPADEWAIERGPGGACAASEAAQPSAPSFDAGTESPIAGTESPVVMNLKREDGTQQFKSLTLTPPEGLVAKLAGIPYCPEAALKEAEAKSGREEQANPSCPAASAVGTVTAAAGAGPAPYYAPGKAYLTGPYKGAPLSLAIVTPAVAGPFDLGTIVVRTALYVNKTTTQITAVSDPIPTILQGIPLDVRSVQVRLDHHGWGVNPTSCDPSSFGGTLTTAFGLATPLQSRFQVAECGRLPFKPQLSLNLKGAIKRGKYPQLTATLTMPEGSANLASVSVALPHSEFLAQEHIGTVCTRVQFAASQCPAESIYGTATVQTPLLGYPLTGNVYLRSSSNKLPDLVPDLRGPAEQPIELEADGRTDSIHGGIRNTFEYVPDAPFTKFTLALGAGRKSLLLNSTNICAKPQKATVIYTAHNGATLEAHPLLKAQCPKKAKKHAKRHAAG